MRAFVEALRWFAVVCVGGMRRHDGWTARRLVPRALCALRGREGEIDPTSDWRAR